MYKSAEGYFRGFKGETSLIINVLFMSALRLLTSLLAYSSESLLILQRNEFKYFEFRSN
jgi:hypothetical protein